jgi:hypothetical protein
MLQGNVAFDMYDCAASSMTMWQDCLAVDKSLGGCSLDTCHQVMGWAGGGIIS